MAWAGGQNMAQEHRASEQNAARYRQNLLSFAQMGGDMSFSEIAPYLTHPLVVVGYALLLFFSVHRVLIKSGVVKPLTQRDSGQVVFVILKYGFWVAVLVLILGFGLQIVGIVGPKSVAKFEETIDSYAKAAKFEKFALNNIGKIVHINLFAEEPYWSEYDCGDFMLWTVAPENPKEPPSTANSSGAAFCISDADGEWTSEEKKRSGYLYTIHRGNLRVEGYFSVVGDIEGMQFGIAAIGLVPSSREFGHDRL